MCFFLDRILSMKHGTMQRDAGELYSIHAVFVEQLEYF